VVLLPFSSASLKTITYLSLGSNVGDREGNLREAIRRLGELGTVSKVSSLYETEPVDYAEQPWFLNCAVELDTDLSPQEFMRGTLDIERAMGRDRDGAQPKGPRTIDIDILLFGDAVIDQPHLKVPHPAMHKRRFVLAPLAEIDAEVIHPVLERSIGELLDELPNSSGTVKRIPGTIISA
jgi:2-amino-4-hydroxy-6-hydroxymethyldihydropteridine diphosphokinase